MILAGGLSRRMGREKAFVPLAGRPMMAHVLARIAPQSGPVAINANGDAARFAQFGLAVISDTTAQQRGPLEGVLTALNWAAAQGADRVLTVPVDTPFLPPDLCEGLQRISAPIALAATADGPHPTIGLWSVCLAQALRDGLDRGMRKLALWAQDQGAQHVMFDDEHRFFNINHPDDVIHAAAYLKAQDAGF
jgi:molybdopterin-guanine dinucleotide biosynthesis protein A